MATTSKTAKKRSAASQAGPSGKKINLSVPQTSEKKRSRPVTQLAPDAGSGSDSDEIDEDDVPEKQDDEVADGEGMDVVEEKAAKDPLAVREARKAQKLLQGQRKTAKPHSSLLTEAKRVWSLARQKNIPPTERQKHIHDLMNVIRGKVKDIVLKHDASRIVQTVVKHGKQKERDEVAVELKGKYRELAQNKYSKFLVTKLIRYCPAHRTSIILEFQSHTLRLLLHREASSVLADAFELYANAYERSLLLRDFYGKEATLFSITSGSTEDKERAKKGLSGVLQGGDTERRKRILTATKTGLMSIFNNPDKGAITHAIVHRALWEYIVAVNESEEGERDKQYREMFECCQEVLAELVHTKDGSRVVREFLARETAKGRKQILKVLKPHILKMCTNEEAQLVLFTAIDVIDDTKLVLKTLVTEITQAADTLYPSPQGRRVLLYLMVPRTRRHFTPAQIASITETDEIRSRTSKKDANIRQNEIRIGASEPLLAWISENAEKISRDPGGSLVIPEILLYAVDDKSKAVDALLKAAAAPYPSTDLASPHVIDLPHTSRMYKTLLQGGHFNRASNTVEKVAEWDSAVFADQLVETLGQDVIVGMCTKGERNGAFVVAEALSGDKAKDLVKSWFMTNVIKEIEESDMKGKNVLLEKIRQL
ncbi:ARM repeat-containing protein [Guyanagaster necrorhizus]|uniref:ARM repeat-containing protein n=1 Tax=Guyanagaster necrorhizus TaxID=856835 RepID=A0A9P7VHA3_9AGAR|nr:ARM repeat-containing protein [Guyanagaster necrorhizus MCA 3950]KAG7440558.1 ARM repeat-containing protein [Guyanagaster necrorhizus MCA 3950]